MKAIGIDVSSRKLNIHITEGGGDYEIPNTSEALECFASEHNLTPNEYAVGCESTSKYHYPAQKFFVMAGYEFRLLNPIVTKQFTAATIRKRKTDISDAKVIAHYVSLKEGALVTAEQLNTSKRSLLRARSTITKHKSAMQKLLSQLERDELTPELKEGMRSVEKAIRALEKTVETLQKQAMKEPPSATEKFLCTIPGIAELSASIIVSEVRNFTRFPSANEFKAFVGIDPKITQSGNSSAFGRMTKRGNPLLRCTLYLSAQVARRYDPELKAYFEKKRAEGKPFRVAVCAVSRKLCERVYTIAMRQSAYIIRQPQTVKLS